MAAGEGAERGEGAAADRGAEASAAHNAGEVERIEGEGGGEGGEEEDVVDRFGVFPSLDGLKIEIRDYFPSKSASLKVKVRNTNVNITYKDSGAGERKILVNGIISEKTTLLFDYEYLNDNKEIKVEIID